MRDIINLVTNTNYSLVLHLIYNLVNNEEVIFIENNISVNKKNIYAKLHKW